MVLCKVIKVNPRREPRRKALITSECSATYYERKYGPRMPSKELPALWTDVENSESRLRRYALST